jgi:hypothetical protein
MLLFDPKDKRITKKNRGPWKSKVSFHSTIGEVKSRLDRIGLNTDSLRDAVKKLQLVSPDVIDSTIPNFLSNENNLQSFLGWQGNTSSNQSPVPKDIDFLLDELDENSRYSPIGHLFFIRTLCNYLDPRTEVILDLSEVAELWEDFDPEKTDLHRELRNLFANELDSGSLLSQLPIFLPDNKALLDMVHRLDHHELVNCVLVPLLKEMGLKSVKTVTRHGEGELGKDIIFSGENVFGKTEYYAVQVKAKAERIHANAKKKTGNVNTVINQAETALRMEFTDPTDNTEKPIHHALIITSQEVTQDARTQIEKASKNRPNIMLIDDQELVSLMQAHKQVLTQIIARCSSKVETKD